MSDLKIGDRIINREFQTGTIVLISEGTGGRQWYSVKYDFDPSRVFLNHRRNIERVIEADLHLQAKQPIDKINVTIKGTRMGAMKFEIGKYYRTSKNEKVKLMHVFNNGALLFANSAFWLVTSPDGGSLNEYGNEFIVCEWEDPAPILKMHAPCLIRDTSDGMLFDGPYAHSLDHAKAQVELWNKDSERPCELIRWPAYENPHWPTLEVKE